MEEKVKKKTTFWLPPDIIDRMDSWLKADNCRSRNEFVEKALRFYMGLSLLPKLPCEAFA